MLDLRFQLAEAAREGRSEDIVRLLREGADPASTTQGAFDHGSFLDQVTPLMIAAGSPRSNLDTVNALLEAGADPRQTASGGVTAAWYAAGGGSGYPLTVRNLAHLAANHAFRNWGGGDVARLERLLDAGADPGETASNGRSLLSEACHLGDPDRLRLLLTRGARWNIRFNRFINPLFNAAESGSAECVRLLLDAGFPLDFEDKGKNALHHASNVDVAMVLLDAGLQSQNSRSGHDPIFHALEHEAWDAARFLIERLPSEAARQKSLLTNVLHFVGIFSDPLALRLLIEMGADVRVSEPTYGSPIHAACWQGGKEDEVDNEPTREILALLVDHGADLNLRNAYGNTPLHEATSGDWELPTAVKFLLERGAEVDATNNSGQTPLLLAVDNNSLSCVRLLTAAGADASLARKAARRNLRSSRGWLNSSDAAGLARAEEIARLIGA